MPLRQHNDFSAGVVQDVSRHTVPDKAVYQGIDVFLKEDDTLSRRGGWVTALSGTSQVRPSNLALLDSSEIDNVLTGIIYDDLTGGGPGTVVSAIAFTPGPAAFAPSALLSLAIGAGLQEGAGWATGAISGRPARYFNRILRPNGIPSSIAAAHGYRAFSMYGGASFTKTTARTGTASITLTQGDPVLTGFAAADVSAVEVGMMVRFSNGTNNYTGRIIALPSPTTIAVSPTPTSPTWNTGGATTWVMAPIIVPIRRAITSPIIGARALTVWGDRVILGGVAYDALNAGTKLDVRANRIAWSVLPALDSGSTGGILFDGCREGGIDEFIASNFTDVMGLETLIGLEPVNQGELLVLGYPRCYRVTGYFSTITTQAGGGNTWDTRPLQDAVAAISDRATATTPIGIMFAAIDGVYLYRNGKADNVLDGRMRKLWRSTIAQLIAAGYSIDNAITGGGYIGNNTYVVFFNGAFGGMVCNMDRGGFRWNQIGGGFGGGGLTNIVADPTRPPAAYTAPFQDSAVSTVNKLVRVETFFTPDATNQSDSQGSGPTPQITTRAYTEGDPAQLKVFKALEVVIRLKRAAGGGTCLVSVAGGLDAEEGATVLTAIPSNATGAAIFTRYSFQPRIISKALSVSFILSGSKPDEFEIISVKIDSEPLNDKRGS